MALIVSMPRCESCGAFSPFQCPYCQAVMTCTDCLHKKISNEGDITCEHYETTPLKSTGWEGPPLAK